MFVGIAFSDKLIDIDRHVGIKYVCMYKIFTHTFIFSHINAYKSKISKLSAKKALLRTWVH